MKAFFSYALLMHFCFILGSGNEQLLAAEGEWKKLDVKFEEKPNVTCLTISPDGKFAAWGHEMVSKKRPSPITIVEIATGKTIKELRGHAFRIHAIAYSNDGKRVFAGDDRGFMSVWDVETGKELANNQEHTTRIYAIRPTPDGKSVFSCSSNVKVWKDDFETPKASFDVEAGHLKDVLFCDKEGTKVIVVGYDRAVLWDLAEMKAIARTPDELSEFVCAAKSADEKSVYLGNVRGQWAIIDRSSMEIKNTHLFKKNSRITSLMPLNETRCLLTGEGDLEVMNIDTGKSIEKLRTTRPQRGRDEADRITGTAVSTDGTTAAIADGLTMQVWRLEPSHTKQVGDKK